MICITVFYSVTQQADRKYFNIFIKFNNVAAELSFVYCKYFTQAVQSRNLGLQ